MFLGYYRNSVGRVFAPEGMVICSLFKHRETNKATLEQDIDFLKNLLSLEYFISTINIDDILNSLKNKNVIEETDGGLFKLRKEQYWEKFFGSFIWPFIECYWGLLLYLHESLNVHKDFLCSKVILYHLCRLITLQRNFMVKVY